LNLIARAGGGLELPAETWTMRVDPERIVGRFASKIDWRYERFIGSPGRCGLGVGKSRRGRTCDLGGAYTGDK